MMAENLLGRAEANQPVLINIDPQGVVTRHIDINPAVKLATIDKKRSTEVLLYNHWSFLWDSIPFVDHLDANTSSGCRLKPDSR